MLQISFCVLFPGNHCCNIQYSYHKLRVPHPLHFKRNPCRIHNLHPGAWSSSTHPAPCTRAIVSNTLRRFGENAFSVIEGINSILLAGGCGEVAGALLPPRRPRPRTRRVFLWYHKRCLSVKEPCNSCAAWKMLTTFYMHRSAFHTSCELFLANHPSTLWNQVKNFSRTKKSMSICMSNCVRVAGHQEHVPDNASTCTMELNKWPVGRPFPRTMTMMFSSSMLQSVGFLGTRNHITYHRQIKRHGDMMAFCYVSLIMSESSISPAL